MVFKVAAGTLFLFAKKYYIRLAEKISPEEVASLEDKPLEIATSDIH
jgi:hypothetical protein